MVAGQFETHYSAAVLPVTFARARAGIQAPHAWALKGCVLAEESALDPGWVVIDGTKIEAVTTNVPEGVQCVDTAGVILPGLIDLHGHPNWNVLAAWEPPHSYPNRGAWRNSDNYKKVVKDPIECLTNHWQDERATQLLARYGEIRALVGGATAIQGDNAQYNSLFRPLVRHVDLGPFGTLNAAAAIDPLKLSPSFPQEERERIIQGLADHSITAFYAHVAEGIDDKSRTEIYQLARLRLLTSATVIIHGTALGKAELDLVLSAGAKLVWSPQSNLRLYGRTTQAAKAREMGIPLGLGADWLPSGSASLLDEIQVARRILAEQADFITPKELVKMVTSEAAEIADLADNLGYLTTGRPADLLVVQRHHEDPYESICRSGRMSVELVVIDGKLVYGRDDWFVELAPSAKVFDRSAPDATGERLWAWGKQMRLDLGPDSGLPTHLDNSPLHPFPRRLSGIRAELLDRYARAGPIFA